MAARTLVLAIALAALAPSTLDPLACGGPAWIDLEPSIDWRVGESLGEITGLGDLYEWSPRNQFLFLYPATLSSRGKLADLWFAAYGFGWHPDREEATGQEAFREMPDPAAFPMAIDARDWRRAERVARGHIERILDMPAPQADLHQGVFRQAIEFVELAPVIATVGDERAYDFLSGRPTDAPLPEVFERAKAIRLMSRNDATRLYEADPHQARAGTLRFVMLAEAMRRDIPNGWASTIAKETPPETWKRLDDLATAWLADFPAHPLADLVRLMRERLYYFQQRFDDAMDVLVDVYARHPARALYEMRFLVKQGYHPRISRLLARDVPPEVITGFVASNYSYIDPDDWDWLWELAEVHPKEPWATNLQERLLRVAAGDQRAPLPARYPTAPSAPTQIWGQLRLYTLVLHERWDDAEQQLAMLKREHVTDLMLARIALARGQEYGAMRAALPEETRQFVIRVLMGDEELERLRSTGTTWERKEAVVALGVRRAAAGEWQAAADLVRRADARRAHLWSETARLGAGGSPAALLRRAAFLFHHREDVFYPESGPWYRSLSQRWATRLDPQVAKGVPIRAEWTPQYEHDAIERHLLRNPAWLALQDAVAALDGLRDAGAKQTALREADAAYNRLINATAYGQHFWQTYLDDNAVVHRLREVGRDVRATVQTQPPGHAG